MIHSSVSEGSTEEKIVDGTILKQRRVIKKHNTSYVVRYGLQEAQKRLGIKVRPLIQDVVNRWRSTRVSTQSLLDHEDDRKEETASAVFGHELQGFLNAQAVNEALRKHNFKQKEKINDYMLTRTDFDIFSTTLGGNKFVTGSIAMPVMKTIQMNLKPDEDDKPYIARMKAVILKDFLERTAKNVNFSFLLKATALDPRYKKLKVVEKKEKRDTVFQSLADEARKHIVDSKVTTEGVKEEPIQKKRKVPLAWDESDEEDEGDEDVIKREVNKSDKSVKVITFLFADGDVQGGEGNLS